MKILPHNSCGADDLVGFNFFGIVWGRDIVGLGSGNRCITAPYGLVEVDDITFEYIEHIHKILSGSGLSWGRSDD